MKNAYIQGYNAAVNEYETGDVECNPYPASDWGNYVNWGIGYRDGTESCEE